MGGQSYKCPYCDKWFLYQRDLRNHLKDKHGIKPHYSLDGVAYTTKLIRKDRANANQHRAIT